MKNICKNPPYLVAVGILLFLVWPLLLWAQGDNKDSNPGLTASIAPETARLGSTVVLTLDYRLPEGGWLPDKPQIKGLGDLTIIETETGPGRISIKMLVDQLDSWETGPLSLAYLDKDGKPQALTADPASVEVLSNLGQTPGEATLRPIQGIIPTESLWMKYLPWGGFLFGALVAAAGFFWWQRRRRIQKVSAELLDPPHVVAKREIEQLEAEGLFERGHVKGFYFRFSEILRRYLEALRGFPAAEFTIEEISLCIKNEEDRRLLSLLRQADLVKFADAVPPPARKQEEVKTALSYIHETSVPPEAIHSTSRSGEAV